MTLRETLRDHRLPLLGVILLLAGAYYGIVPDMVKDWYHDENYSHGFIVPLIAGYFIYTRWDELKETPVRPWNLGLVVVALGLCQLLVGWLGVEYFTMRSSLIVLLAGMVLYFFGKAVFRVALLPIAYLFFMVPIPYIIYDIVAFPLKLFVTRVSVAFMKMVGVVVLREGNIIMFPTTTLEVADACSGIRSLLSLLALAVAYAFFVQTTTARRWLIIASAVPIAIATNAMRVIVTGILAQWWGAKAAEGFFHEFAGMAVFALAMVLLVAVGALVKRGSGEEPLVPTSVADASTHITHKTHETHITLFRFVVVYVLLIAAGLFINLHRDMTVPTSRPLSSFPSTVGGWRMTSEFSMSDAVIDKLKPTDYLSRAYENGAGQRVTLYVGYHGGGKEGGEIHSPKHCLPGSGWHEATTERTSLPVGDGHLQLVRAVYEKGESKELFLYWFQVRDKSLSDEYSLKLAEIVNSFLHRRRDASFIRISVPFTGETASATALGEGFVRDILPGLGEFLPR